MKKKSIIFGPVPSRRLGLSLGVDIVPFKTCSLDCIYCQLGCTEEKTVARKRYVRPEEVLSELKAVLAEKQRIDWITFSGSGEPTLNEDLGEMIRGVKKLTSIPVAVLTNATLLSNPVVREELRAADLVVPSLDAGTEEAFREINRPHPDLSLKELVEGTAIFTEGFPGEVWLEVMLAAGINDSPVEIGAITERIAKIKPAKVQLNTIVRPPARETARPLSAGRLAEISISLEEKLAGIPVEAAAPFRGGGREEAGGSVGERIIDYLKRRPATLDDFSAGLGVGRKKLLEEIAPLLETGKVEERSVGSKRFFVVGGGAG